jgi:hypothetical protein
MGVFRKDKKGFVGIREKFGERFLFVEYHWDTGPPFGTVKPLKCLERCPVENLDEHIESHDKQLETNRELFDWLKQKGSFPPAWLSRRKHLDDLQMLLKRPEEQRDRKQ